MGSCAVIVLLQGNMVRFIACEKQPLIVSEEVQMESRYSPQQEILL
jgi:hypothetical protein